MTSSTVHVNRRAFVGLAGCLAVDLASAAPSNLLVPRLSKVTAGDLEWAVAGGEAAEVSVLLESGLSESMEVWRSLVPLLAKRHRVIAWNRPGIGRSAERNVRFSPDSYAAALNDVLKTADVRGPVVLVGHAAGAMMAEAFARLSPQRVAGLVAVDPMAYDQEALLAKYDRSLSVQVKAMTRLWPGAMGQELRQWDDFELAVKKLPSFGGPVLGISPSRPAPGIPHGYFHARRQLAFKQFERFERRSWLELDANSFVLEEGPELLSSAVSGWIEEAMRSKS